MIYTLTVNPALDYVMRAENIELGKTNRSQSELIQFGGKGINVSFVLASLSLRSVALGFVGGFTGDALKSELEKNGINADFVTLSCGITRINVKIKGAAITELNAKGPTPNKSEIEALHRKISALSEGDTLVLAGSAGALGASAYSDIAQLVFGRGVRLVVDAEGELLTKTLKYSPFVIKPNIDELSAVVNRPLTSDSEIEAAARELQALGARNVLVSLGADGALLVDEYGLCHRKAAPAITVVNTVGAGDSMLAGFIAGVDFGYSYDDALSLAISSGSASASVECLARREDIERLFGRIG